MDQNGVPFRRVSHFHQDPVPGGPVSGLPWDEEVKGAEKSREVGKGQNRELNTSGKIFSGPLPTEFGAAPWDL